MHPPLRLLLILLVSAPAWAQPIVSPSTLPAGIMPVHEKIDVPALVREVRASESWIDDVESCRVVLQATLVRSPESVENLKAAYIKQDPKDDLSPDRHPELLARSTQRADIAFDRTRAVVRRVGLDDGTLFATIWDGRQTFTQMQASRLDSVHTTTSDIAPGFASVVLNPLSCFKTAHHSRWPVPVRANGRSGDDPGPSWFGRPEDFTLAGRTTYRGTDCYLLVCAASYRRWFVGVDDHRIYGVIQDATMGDADAKEKESLARQLSLERTGQAMTLAQFDAWARKLPPDKLDELLREIMRRTHHLAEPFIEYWVRDYKELSPGRFFPMTHGMAAWPRRPDTFSREGTIVEIEVNQPLPDDLLQ